MKETRITDGGRTVRYLLCRDTERVAQDRAVRQEIVARLQEEFDGSRTAEAHTRKACTLLAHRGYARYLRETEKVGRVSVGRIETDQAASTYLARRRTRPSAARGQRSGVREGEVSFREHNRE